MIVLDGAGIGALPDAVLYGDEHSNTIGNVAKRVSLAIPTLRALGLGSLVELGGSCPARPQAAFGKMAEVSAGKDSVTGHWELMGVTTTQAFPVFPDGFPESSINEFEQKIGRSVMGNVAASGTEIIQKLGAEHLSTGSPIVYTSADSVCQIAAHEDVIPVDLLYRFCETAYDIMVEGIGVARVIARPFTGPIGSFERTAQRRDFAQPPSGLTLLDRVHAEGLPVVAIGKVSDLFAGRGISESVQTGCDDEVMTALNSSMRKTTRGLLVANCVDFDTVYGHRNDVMGYAANLERFDRHLLELLPYVGPNDLLVITADHGNDPTTPGSDHSREYVPLLVIGRKIRNIDLGVRHSFADVGQTLSQALGVSSVDSGESFIDAL